MANPNDSKLNTALSGGLGRGGRIAAWAVAFGLYVRFACFCFYCCCQFVSIVKSSYNDK
jgi:hypothetical protein